MNYKEYKGIDYAQIGEEILQFWKENKIFEKSIEVREGAPSFTFYEGPPSANGLPGIHHVMARTIKDIFCRYKTLRGYQVHRKGGWDTHGLPIELQVEKELGITKDDIGKKISVEEYNQKCREAVMRFTGVWQDMTDKMGYWVDMNDPYITYKNEYIESVWWLLKQLHEKDLLYKGYSIQPYSPAAGTGLSSHELNQPGCYRDVKDTSIVAQFRLAEQEKFSRVSVWLNSETVRVTKFDDTDKEDIKAYRKRMEANLFKNFKGEVFFNPTLNKNIEVSRRGLKEVLSFSPTFEDVAALTELKALLENSTWIESAQSLYDAGEIFHYLLNEIEIESKKFTVKIVLKQIGLAYRLYDVTLTEKEKSQVIGIARISESDDDNHLGHRKDKRLFEILQIKNQQFLETVPQNTTNINFLAWTTTPWTLPANCGLTVGEKIDYVLVKTYNPYTYEPVNVILAKALMGKCFSEKAKDIAFDDYKAGDKLIPFEVLAEYKGKDLVGLRYEQLIPAVTNDNLNKNAFRVIAGDFVTTEDGTGIVHTASVFGADDFRVCQQNGVPSVMVLDENGKDVPVVDRKGKFVNEVGEWLVENVAKYGIKTHRRIQKNGFYVKNYLSEDEKQTDYKTTDEIISIILKQQNGAFKVERYEHSYPHCWRTDKPVLYYPLDSWFIATTKKKDRLVELNKTINWAPESTGTGRFGNWLENLVDWNLSRSRFWGTPLPIWRTEDGSEEICIGSIDELQTHLRFAIEQLSDLVNNGQIAFKEYLDGNNSLTHQLTNSQLDLHRPYVDRITLMSKSGKLMFRETDLIDVWFDSGAMPYAQWHHPFEAPVGGLGASFPADFISEGVDQTRGWFFTLHAIAGMLFDSVAFKNVVSTGLVLDKNGNKMSKRLGNAIDPFETMAKYGPDATRWYMITNAEPWDNLKFNLEGIGEVQRKFFGTLFNTYNFYALYANLDNYKTEQFDRVPKDQLTELDRWIISKIYTLAKEVAEQYDAYNPTKAGRLIQDFVCDDLSNWYVRLSRRRFWNTSPQTPEGGLNNNSPFGTVRRAGRGAFQTLQHALCAVAQLMSPIAPFFGDWLYRNMTESVREESIERNTPFKHESVHFTDWHTYEPEWVDTDLEESMALAQKICSLVHSLRKGNSLKVRQPLSKVLIPVLSEKTRKQIESVTDIIMAEVNVKAVEFLNDDSNILKKKIKPNFKVLGPKYGKSMKAVADFILAMTPVQIKELEQNEPLVTHSVIQSFNHLHLEDVEILAEDVPGWLVASEGSLTVALDVTITDELRREGIARDVVNRIQNLRKDSGFEVTDKIQIALLNNNPELTEAVQSQKAYICNEVQAVSLEIVETLPNATEIAMDEFLLGLLVEVV
jgi:isoleucyl-tRNA synthetase